MDQFTQKFGKRVETYFEDTQEQNDLLLAEVMDYANANPIRFKAEMKEIQFISEFTSPLPIVLEALAKDTGNWGQFYIDLMNEIFAQAKLAKKPRAFLIYLSEFYYVEKDTRPFVQKIVDILSKEIESDNVYIKIAAIYTILGFLDNSSIRNKGSIIAALQQKLGDAHWKVRYTTYIYLKGDNLLPPGKRLALKDLLLKLIFGAPSLF